MDEKKQEAYMEVRDELLQKREFVLDIHNKIAGKRAALSPQVEGVLCGIEYALIIIDNLMLQDRKS